MLKNHLKSSEYVRKMSGYLAVKKYLRVHLGAQTISQDDKNYLKTGKKILLIYWNP